MPRRWITRDGDSFVLPDVVPGNEDWTDGGQTDDRPSFAVTVWEKPDGRRALGYKRPPDDTEGWTNRGRLVDAPPEQWPDGTIGKLTPRPVKPQNETPATRPAFEPLRPVLPSLLRVVAMTILGIALIASVVIAANGSKTGSFADCRFAAFESDCTTNYGESVLIAILVLLPTLLAVLTALGVAQLLDRQEELARRG